MARANVLNTRTITYLELIGNGRSYRVPPYQRDYSWSEEQWDDLWADVLALRPHPDRRHYLGALVVEEKSDREFLVIDGQQRLATLSLLVLAVIARLGALAGEDVDAEANAERARELRNRFVGEKDPASLTESSRLYLNETDDAFYQDYLVQLRPLNPRGLPASNRLLWDCFRWFVRRLGALDDDWRNDGRAVASLLSETAARQLLFILITVDDELNAYTVFETLNARGLELTTTDLLKNYLFSRVRAADLDALRRRWQALTAVVDAARFPEFLRHHMLCELPRVRSQRLFKIVRDRTRTTRDVFALLDSLERRAELFAAVSDPNHGYWTDLPGARDHVRELDLFRVRQAMPLLFAAWETFDGDDFVRVLKLVSVVSFRYTVVSDLNPGALEAAWHHAARAVLDGAARRPGGVFEPLRPIYVDDDRMRRDFALLSVNTRGRRRRLAKYVLARLEADAAGRGCDPDTDPGTVEHVLPENPAGEWTAAFASEHRDAAVHRLGNLTLLEAAANRAVGAGGYALTRRIPELAPERWTPALLEARQHELADRAVRVWRSDFA